MVPVSAHHAFCLKCSVESHPVPISVHVHERAVALDHHQRRLLSILSSRGSSDDASNRFLSASSRRAPLPLQISATRASSRGRLPRRRRQRPERERRFRRRDHTHRPRLARRTLWALPSSRRASRSVCPNRRPRASSVRTFVAALEAASARRRKPVTTERGVRRATAERDNSSSRSSVRRRGRSTTRARRPKKRRGEIDANAADDQRATDRERVRERLVTRRRRKWSTRTTGQIAKTIC